MFQISSDEIKELVFRIAKEHGINPYLVLGIIKTESAFDVIAYRYEKHYKWVFNVPLFAQRNKISVDTEIMSQQTSWGLMQVMGAVFREYGFKDKLLLACDPEINIDVGCRHLNKLYSQFKTEDNVVSAYNQGRPNRLMDGRFKNFEYVEKVFAAKKEFESLK